MRTLYLVFGWMALVLGFVGVFLPLLPTTPFVILAAFFFSKSSHTLHRWLITHKTFGPYLKEWEDYRVIRLRAKIIATVMAFGSISYPIFFKDLSNTIKMTMFLSVVFVFIYIWTRPSVPPEEKSK